MHKLAFACELYTVESSVIEGMIDELKENIWKVSHNLVIIYTWLHLTRTTRDRGACSSYANF